MVGVVLSAHEVEIIVTLLGGGGLACLTMLSHGPYLGPISALKKILFVFLLSPIPFPYFGCACVYKHMCPSVHVEVLLPYVCQRSSSAVRLGSRYL